MHKKDDILLLLVKLHVRLGSSRFGKELARHAGRPFLSVVRILEQSVAQLPAKQSAEYVRKLKDMTAGIALLAFPNEESGLLPYPQRLIDSLKDLAPPILYVAGNAALLKEQSVAIIGTRRPSGDGLAAAHAYATELAINGITVTSGNAPGIDAAVHQKSTDAGGNTVVFPPSPLDSFVPVFQCEQARDRVAIISPFVPESTIQPWNFLARNGLVAGFCHAAFVAETGFRGGTHDTIKKLVALRRPVFAAHFEPSAPHFDAHALLFRSGIAPLPSRPDAASIRMLMQTTCHEPPLRDLQPRDLFESGFHERA
jgi:predicted Rossmann fold nucleotide-binding protein DprA/Smf involved in DNA uptake